MNILDTASEENIYKSLDKILNVESCGKHQGTGTG